MYMAITFIKQRFKYDTPYNAGFDQCSRPFDFNLQK
jgi:hypothetical protein